MTSKIKWVSSIENTPVAQGRHSDSAVDMDRRELFGVGEDLRGLAAPWEKVPDRESEIAAAVQK